MLLDETIKDLVRKIEVGSNKDSESFDINLRELIVRLRENFKKPEVLERYEAYKRNKGEIGKYPTDSEGYAVSFDPIEDEESFWNAWLEHGMVVGRNIISKEKCNHAIQRMHEITSEISDGKCDLDDPETWKDAPVDENNIPFISRGFFEVYHDRALSEIRQAIRLYIHHVMIWGRVDLWTSFDRLGVTLPGHKESFALPLHVDQNPLFHPDFKTVQGVIALVDGPTERGTFVGVPGSKSVFEKYGNFAPERGELVELLLNDPVAQTLQENAQTIPLRAGNIVSWDSRTTHANTENKSDKARYVAYVAAGPAPIEKEWAEARNDAFKTGIGSNVREALMHASKKARYSNYEKLEKVRKPEELTLLGRLLYGQESYEKI